MKEFLQQAGYVLEPLSNIWSRSGYSGIAYSDGDEAEQRIAAIISHAFDVTVLSTELRQHCTDWASLYHLSGTRANILRPFKNVLQGDVLEIGAGCGAITRYLGECGANVLALEGSPRRAAIARSRTRDLDNVTVLAEKFDQFQCDHQFDVITLIGVLEYANLFTTGENPALSMLERVRSLLKPEGKLIIAIENQLGLKYFAGAPEDHLGQSIVGIEGRYRKDQPQTFGRKVLAGMLEQAGFAAQEFLAPFPDYKLPVSIITEEGFSNKKFDAAAFAWQSARRDPQLPTYCNFSLELAWPQVFQNGLGLDVTNSFLIIAAPNSQQLIATGELAYHYSVDRIPAYCKETVFTRSDGGDIRVGYRRLDTRNGNADEANGLIRFVFPDADKYVVGRPLSLEFIGIVTNDGWTFDQLARFVRRYLLIVGTFFSPANMQASMASPYAELPGEFFDVVPQNIIICEDGNASLIDKEWQLTSPIEVAHLLFRSLLLLINSITRFGLPASQAVMTRYQFIDGVFAAAGLRVQERDYIRYISLEANIQQSVTGRAAENYLTWGKDQPLPILNLSQAVVERDGQIASLNQTLAEQSQQITHLNQAVAERDAAVALINTIKRSASWRLTQPLRFVARLARYGLTNEDRQRLTQALRNRYHCLPLPAPAKRLVSFTYHRIFRNVVRNLYRSALQVAQFHAPSIKVIAQHEDKPDYIIWGVIDWHFRHQRPQQFALTLANTERRIFYISPNFTDDERAGFEVEALDAAGLLFQVKLFVKGAPVIYSSAPGVESVSQLRGSIGEMLSWANSQQLISLVQHPFWYDVASVLPNSRLIYDCMDHHDGFGNNAESLLQLEKTLLQEAELTVTTSTWLDEAVASHAKQRALIRNAGDFDHFASMPDSVYRDPQGRRIIGYYGAIAEWFDLDLVEAVARQHPECCVLLIGADTGNAKSRFGKLPNVTFTGEVPYGKLPHYLYSFDVCLLPFKVIPLTLATNPVKVYEFLSAGKPVVTVDLPEMAQFDGLVYVAPNKEAFLAAVSAVLSQPEPDALIQQRKAFAQGQTWQHRAEALIQHAESAARDPKVSVVVLTYNNLDLTRACLASLVEHSQYEHMEVVVVDNASSDGSQAFLSEWVANGRDRKLILNEDNRGFAAGNNQGMAIATGDYLVMLNNDTYVTPGWIRTLLKHLQRDKTIGLIGPVTNNIGNEAKIDIAYKGMDEMLLKSAAYTRRHVGQTCPLRTAAFFCVMMPRTTYERVGTLDEAFGRGFFEDDDYCRRIEQLGLRVVCAEDVFIHHHLSASFNKLKQQDRQKLFEDNKKIYEAKWGEWMPHDYRGHESSAQWQPEVIPDVFGGQKYFSGHCIVCGKPSRFFYQDIALWRESLNCQHCRGTSRYRSITKGLLRAITELTGSEASSLATLPHFSNGKLRVYDTQPPFYYAPCAYPLPDLLKATGWIDVELSQYKPNKPMGKVLAKGVTNQNLECLTFADASLDIVITSDVMEHVRLDERAHQEIYRVLKPGGLYIFTVPHNRAWDETLIRVQITDPDDPSKDIHLLEPEYHGDTNSDEGGGVLAYRTYGKDIEEQLKKLGFEVEYFREDMADVGILNTELYYCRKKTC